jgi:TPR repeat protein
MSKTMKFFIGGLFLVSTVLAYVLNRPQSQPVWDGSALLAKAEQSLEGLPAKEAAVIRALLVSTGPTLVDDRAHAWLKTCLKKDLEPVAEFALANLRALAESGDTSAMSGLSFVLTQRIATADEGFRWLRKAAEKGHAHSVFLVTSRDLKDKPAELLKAMTEFAGREDDAGYQALYWFAFAHEKGQHGLPQDATKATDYRNRAKALGEKLQAAATAK